jgi:hypothetical protein
VKKIIQREMRNTKESPFMKGVQGENEKGLWITGGLEFSRSELCHGCKDEKA